MMDTLAFRVPREHLGAVLGTIAAYHLTDEFSRCWQELVKAAGRTPRYSTLTTALTAFGNRPVGMFVERTDMVAGSPRERLLLAADHPFDHRLPNALRVWERLVRGGALPERWLADSMPPVQEELSLSDFVQYREDAVVRAPNWVFRTAAWHIAQRLATQDLPIGQDRSLRLRVDTEGRLLAWDVEDLISDPSGREFGMASVSVSLATRTGVPDPVLCFDAHVSRLSHLGTGRHLWIDRGADKPVLRLPLYKTRENGEWSMRLDETVPEIIGASDLDPLQLPEGWPRSCWELKPGTFRPQSSARGFNRLGSGLGPRFMLRLHEHIVKVFPELESLDYVHDKSIKLAPRQVKYPEGGYPAESIPTSGFPHLTLACVYQTAEARTRMLDELSKLTGLEVRPGADGSPFVVHEGLEIVARYSPDLLAHGLRNRAAAWESLGLGATEDRLTCAWLETEYPFAAGPRPVDAKPHLRRLLGQLRVPTQFLATEPFELPSGTRPRSAKAKVHSARAALRDLLRAAGVIDPRLFNAVCGPRLKLRPTHRVKLVGVHVRRQQSWQQGVSTVLTMVALVVDPLQAKNWRLLMFNEAERRWTDLASGISSFHTGLIGEARPWNPELARERTQELVEARLAALADLDGADDPMVVFANAQGARWTWAGMQNDQFGAGPLPGDTLVDQGRELAVVRVNASLAEIGRPVSRTGESGRPADPAQPAAPGQRVYRLVDATLPSWYLPGRSVRSAARYGNVALEHTRWSLVKGAKALEAPWDAFTAMEIVVARPGSWEPAELAALCARLSDQPISWDGRTNNPVPLHIAAAVDKDHPDFRSDGESADEES